VGTPVFVYSRAEIEQRWQNYDEAFGGRNHLICYSVKANSSLAVLNILAKLGSGFDIVSVGELERVLKAGGDPKKTIFSGVGKTEVEMRRALEVGIYCFNIESIAELDRLNAVALSMSLVAPVSVRVNPDVDANTHPYIATGLKESKFGIAIEQAGEVYTRASEMEGVHVAGIDCHIGSQLTEIDPFLEALDRTLELVGDLHDQGITLEHIDIGGGLGISYYDEQPPEPAEFIVAMMDRFQGMGSRYQNMKFIIEPGRSIVGNAGVMLTKLEYLKVTDAKNFAIVDAAMNNLMRPALYDAWHEIVPLVKNKNGSADVYDVVGPICESGDFLGRGRELDIAEGDYLAVLSAGAYGAVMSSNYNTRPRASEVMVSGDAYHIIRQRENMDDLMRGESLLPD
jgi:diaminopimelate decarboxylase